MFEEYIGRHLKNRHKAIGLKYARSHGYPELISPSSYGICFKDEEDDAGNRLFLVFRIYFKSEPVYIGRKHVPGRSVKTITEIVLFGEGYSVQEMMKAEQTAAEYLKLAVEEDQPASMSSL